MPTSIAIIGASGSVGSALAAQILRSETLGPSDRLQLVGHGSSKSERLLLAERVDLLDAFDDERVEIEMVPKIADVDADIVVVAAGVGFSPQCANRRDMGMQNRELFESIAEDCARNVPDALFIVVSNPVELAVRILAERLDRRQVIGMGAQQDSLRFARAIAKDLGISRHEVRASVLGEHGQAMVPLWSSVELQAPTPELLATLALLKAKSAATPLQERVVALRSEVTEHLQAERVPEAYEAARRALPDARVFIEPFITGYSLHSTPNATANATLQCIVAALANDRRRIHGQVKLVGEVLDLNGACGIPITLSRDGWSPESLNELNVDEKNAIFRAVESINEFAAEVLA
jgi:malate dehydrogenase